MNKIVVALALVLALVFVVPPSSAQAAVCYPVTVSGDITGNFTFKINGPSVIREARYVALWNIGTIQGGSVNGTNTITGKVVRLDPSKGFTLEVNLYDGCGTHRTFVGNGKGWSPNTGFPG